MSKVKARKVTLNGELGTCKPLSVICLPDNIRPDPSMRCYPDTRPEHPANPCQAFVAANTSDAVYYHGPHHRAGH
jgi:hypothetical protein